jgi:hypothetical protein
LALFLVTASTVRPIIPDMKIKMAKSHVFYDAWYQLSSLAEKKLSARASFSTFAGLGEGHFFHRIANVYDEEKKNFANG